MASESNKIISVIIVACGAGDYLASCLDSVLAQLHPADEIIVIVNQPGQTIDDTVRLRHTSVKVLRQKENLFYCQALNIGIGASKGDFVLCLNDDVVLDKRFIKEALRGFAIDERVGLVSGKIVRPGGLTIDSTGLFLNYCRKATERGYGRRDTGQFEKQGYVFGVNGAVAFYRRKMLEDIKENGFYFDPAFRIFYEDVDISWRAARRGWKGYYVPAALAYHVRGGTVRQGRGIDKPYARRYLAAPLHADLIKNRYLTMIRNESLPDFLLHLPGIALYECISWLYILCGNRPAVGEFFLQIRHIRDAFRKRLLRARGREV